MLLIRLPLDTTDVDAFSLPFHDRPVIVLGADKNDRARSRFDGAHELGHLVVHGDQVWGVKEVERQAHAFAAAFLMPAEDIRDELPDRADWPCPVPTETEMAGITGGPPDASPHPGPEEREQLPDRSQGRLRPRMETRRASTPGKTGTPNLLETTPCNASRLPVTQTPASRCRWRASDRPTTA
ncbi:MAG: ImmA/IrrE family metallo-endopeptidase [Streptosporangiaceae bacterium]